MDNSVKLLVDLVEKYFFIVVANFKPCSHILKYIRFEVFSHARFDNIYASISLTLHISQYLVTPVSFPDHCLVTLHIGEPGQGRSNFDWDIYKFNRKPLGDDRFPDTVVGSLRNLGNPHVSPFELCEYFKDNVKMSAIERSSKIIFETSVEEKKLIKN